MIASQTCSWRAWSSVTVKAMELVERHAVLGIDVEQDGRCGREAQALLDHLDRDEERCGDLLLGLALHPHILEGAELVQRMHGLGYASSVLLAERC